MLSASDIIAFIGTTGTSRAKEFYQERLGLPLGAEEPGTLVFDAHGIMLRVTEVQQHVPARYTILGWRVSDIASAITQLSEKGVKFNRYPGFAQDEEGVWTAPDGTKVAWFHDPDGNTLSLTQFPEKGGTDPT